MTDDTSPVRPPGPGRTSVLRLSGELDYDTGRELTACLDAAVAERPAVLAVDLSEVTFADSFALRVLVLAHLRLQEAGGAMVLVGQLAPSVRRLLEITATDRHFTLADSVTAAERAVAGHGPAHSGTP
ncbi:STAS domain-containing protein [Kitasatospora sp. NPDC058115]|uniref:STAS domain-containing protein n=1 Tax=Kitasatospora sp. NPDC058115 TaxID=3346347 RepID=UPI0036DF30E1